MADREKLKELLLGLDVYNSDECRHCEDYYTCKDDCFTEKVADHLIANGVVVRELDGCEYCKEDSEGYRKMLGAFSITNPFHGTVWNIETRHCKPRQIYFCPLCGRRLSQPPKGEAND